ncbi:MAG: ShlB/FhaC/HecB family hemolysin secretion/activation protein [Gammaproteobacteria bacterium]|nr:ShlB/FhaC/HecB family hemolysin secretion/activation protein [Gammaproteobacteria bacterium]
MQIRLAVRSLLGLIAVLAWSYSPAGLAQGRQGSTPPLPETTGAQTRRPPPVQKPTPPPEVEQVTQKSPVSAPEKRILVRGFTFQGVTLFDPRELEPVVRPYINRELTLLEIYEAADRVADFYVAHGYTLATVAPPAQKISDGVVKLQVIEGRIGAVSVEGAERYSPERIKDYLGALAAGRIYRTGELEDGLYRVNRMPGLFAKAVLAPGQQYGTSDLTIKTSERFLGTSLVVDNFGRDNLGEMRTSASLTVNNPLRIADQVQVLGLVSQGGLLKYGFLGYSTLLMRGQLRASASYGGADFEVGDVDFTGENRNTRAGLEYLIRGDKETEMSLSFGVSRTVANADAAGAATSETEITIFEFGGLYSHTYPNFAVTQYLVTLATDFRGSESKPDPISGSATQQHQPLRVELDLQMLYPLMDRLEGFVHINGVYSPESLPPSSVFSVGGPQTVRGFVASRLSGDQGAYESLGLRTGGRLGRAQVFGRVFYDAGFVRREADGSRDGLSSVGLGADLTLDVTERYKLNAKLDLSFPTHDPITATDQEDEDARLFGTVSLSY